MATEPVPVPELRAGGARKAAPGDLLLVQGFVNTLDHDRDDEQLTSAAALERWLVHYELMSPGEHVSDAELAQAIRVREALRALLLANNGAPLDRAAVDTINAAAKTSELLARVELDGTVGLVPVRGGVDGALGRLLAIVYRAQADGTWQRFKGCPDESCGWAFYDWSKNRSATWCSMQTCGNRAKARAYRERQRAPQS